MIHALLATAVVLVHLAFVAFVVLGGLWVGRRPAVAWLHLPAAAWGVAIELFGWVCPLTYLENWLWRRAGEAGYRGGFVEHYLLPVLYPSGLTREVQWAIAAAVLLLNLWIYGVLLRRRGRARAFLPIALVLVAACAARDPHPPRAHLRVVVISDLNGPYGSTDYGPEVHQAVRRIREEWRPDLVVAAGDLIAGQKPSLPDDSVRAMWAAFDAAVAAPLRAAGIPFAFTLGNHDGSAYPAHRRDRALAVEHWRAAARRLPLDFVDSEHFPVRYSFVQGDAFFLVWDASNEDAVARSEMMAWAETQLAGEPSRRSRHRLVLGHLPLQAVAEGRNRRGEVLREPDSLRAMLERHRVRIYLSGHHHAYYPGRRGALELLSAGALGAGPRPYIGSDHPTPRTVTVLDFFADSVAYTTFALDGTGTGGARRIDPATLPPVLRGVNGYTVRRDLPDTLVRSDGESR